MITNIQSSPHVHHNILQENTVATEICCGRIFNPNWEKVTLVCNLALLVTGIVYAFFMKLPLVMVGLGTYSITYLLLNGMVQRSRPSQTQVDDLKAKLTVQEQNNKLLGEKFTQKFSAKEMKEEWKKETKKAEEQCVKAKEKLMRYEKQVRIARQERDNLRKQCGNLR